MAPQRWDLLLGAAMLLGSGTCPSAESLLLSVQACTAEADASQRLACYDRAAERWVGKPVPDLEHCGSGRSGSCSSAAAQPANTSTQSGSTTARAVPTQRAAERESASLSSAESVFGADGLIRKEQPGGQGAPPRQLTARVAALARRPQGMLVLHLENGQVWEQTQDGPDLTIKAGDTVRIDKGVLGAYWVTTSSSHAAIKVRRTH
jgi:hypothetical protein